MIRRQIDTNRRKIIKGLSLSAGMAIFAPRVSHSYSLLKEFPGGVGYHDWYSYVLSFSPRDGKTKEGPLGYPEGIMVDSGRISIKVPDVPENDQVVPITVSFDDSHLSQETWCSELTTILESEVIVVDELGRYFTTKAHQVLFKAILSKRTIPSTSMRFKLSSKKYRIIVVARIRKQDGNFRNISRDFEVFHNSRSIGTKKFSTTIEAARKNEE